MTEDKKYKLKPLFSKTDIKKQVKIIADKINGDFKAERDILCVCVLNGAFMFFSDLVRLLKKDITCAFMRLSSYNDKFCSTGEVKLLLPVSEDLNEKSVLIVEDIVDSGITIEYLKNYFTDKGAKTVKCVCLIDKPVNRRKSVSPDYAAFRLEDDIFVVGYGLDAGQKFRNLDGVYGIEQ